MKSEELRVPTSAYPIGSKRRSLLRLSLLVLAIFTVLAIHFLFISLFLSNGLLTLSLVLGTWILVLFRMSRYLRGWLDVLLRDAAYGVVTESGIHYRNFFGEISLSWSSIAQVDYLFGQGNRIEILKVPARSVSRPLSIHFGPSRANANALTQFERIFKREGTPEKLAIKNTPTKKFFQL
jgi:hypothetical protein